MCMSIRSPVRRASLRRFRRPGRDELALQLRVHQRHFFLGKGEEVLWQRLGAADARVGVTQVVEELVCTALEAGRPQLRVVDLT